jgi:hypothetical protein
MPLNCQFQVGLSCSIIEDHLIPAHFSALENSSSILLGSNSSAIKAFVKRFIFEILLACDSEGFGKNIHREMACFGVLAEASENPENIGK